MTRHIKKHHRLIKVTGESSLPFSPNQAIITVGVITEDPQLTKAQGQNSEITSNVIDSLISLGIPQNHIQTSLFTISPQYDFIDGKQIFRTYQVQHQLQITIDKVEQVGQVIDTAVNHGANMVGNIEFSVTNADVAYNHALTLAVIDAYNKAQTIARTIGVTTPLYPITIRETQVMNGQTPYKMAFAQATPIQPGQIKITASVDIDFEY